MSRTVTHSGAGHTLMGRTWNTPSTIPVLISFYRDAAGSSSPEYPGGDGDWDAAAMADRSPGSSSSRGGEAEGDVELDEEKRLEVRRFYVFGPDLNAHPDLLHGGVVSCILDSGLGGAVGMALRPRSRSRSSKQTSSSKGGLGVDGEGLSNNNTESPRLEEQHGLPTYTVQLNVRYRAPVRTPGGVMVRSWITKISPDRRKIWAAGRVEGPNGVVHAEAEGLWLRAKAKI
jgi:acyl-coenzyme A thioesterase PaaI-like protein